MTTTRAASPPAVNPKVAWSQRVRKVGGYIQLAFSAFWLIRGGLSVGGVSGTVLSVAGVLLSLTVLAYAIKTTAGMGGRPIGAEAKRIERSVTTATVIELIASVALPVIVVAAGHSDWVLPSVAITIGPLLLWLDHLVHIPRLRPVGWALTIGPLALVAVVSGSALAAATGLAAGFLLLATATCGFHDLAGLRSVEPPRTVETGPRSAGA